MRLTEPVLNKMSTIMTYHIFVHTQFLVQILIAHLGRALKTFDCASSCNYHQSGDLSQPENSPNLFFFFFFFFRLRSYFDVIKQNESELTNTIFKIQPNKADSFFCFLLFVQSFNCSCLWNQLPNLCRVFTKLKPEQYSNRKCPKKKNK